VKFSSTHEDRSSDDVEIYHSDISRSSRISSSITGEKRIQNQVRMILIDTSQWIVRRLVFADRLKFRYFSLASTLLSTNVDSTMKKLIDVQQYHEALHVFDEHSHSKSLSDISFNLALKACTKLRSYQRGTEIHRQLSSQSLANPFIQSSLIHFYSE
jgi:sensor histidine kinase regulating citrate/malate metabolism